MASLNTCQVRSPVEDLQTSQGRYHLARRARKKKTLTWRVGTWNVCSMVGTDGSVEVASTRVDSQQGEQRKAVEEMKRYDVKMTALQETKWFGCEVYQVGGSVILISGREKPAVGESMQRGKGVAGRQWKAWSSRMVSACLQVGEGSGGILHVVSCYAPTRAASREMKDEFFLELGHMLSSIPSGEKYVVLGDFNARVGSREYVGDHWDAVRGPHGFGVVNDAGKKLLSFLSVHQATVCI